MSVGGGESRRNDVKYLAAIHLLAILAHVLNEPLFLLMLYEGSRRERVSNYEYMSTYVMRVATANSHAATLLAMWQLHAMVTFDDCELDPVISSSNIEVVPKSVIW